MNADLAIVGAGAIGSRHLQALALLDGARRVHVVDPSRDALGIARTRWQQIEGHDRHEVVWHASMAELEAPLAVAVIATSAPVRLEALRGLLERVEVDHVVLEKVLFQRKAEYTAAADLLSGTRTRAWVNTPRRLWPGYRSARECFAADRTVSLRVCAFDRQGLGTTAIHFLDTLAYLGGRLDFRLSGDFLQIARRKSRRAGYVEYSGTLFGYNATGGAFEFRSHEIAGAPVFVDIVSDERRLTIDETAGRARYADEQTGWEWRDREFVATLQSRLTHDVVNDLEAVGRCELPSLTDAAVLHLAIHDAIVSGHERLTGERLEAVPIT